MTVPKVTVLEVTVPEIAVFAGVPEVTVPGPGVTVPNVTWHRQGSSACGISANDDQIHLIGITSKTDQAPTKNAGRLIVNLRSWNPWHRPTIVYLLCKILHGQML